MNRPADVRDKAGRSAHNARLLSTTTTAHSQVPLSDQITRETSHEYSTD